MNSDFFDNHDGNATDFMQMPWRARLRDLVCDARLAIDIRRMRLLQRVKKVPPQRILVVGVRVPQRGNAMDHIAAQLGQSRHDVTASIVDMQPKGKFENIHDAMMSVKSPIKDFDWLFIADDDVALPPHFTDRYVELASAARLMVSQPAHRFLSHATYHITRRKLGHLVRQTNFVEIGPLTMIHRTAFDLLLPFPPSRWAYGIDVLWADLCRRNGLAMGIVDALPIRHLRPVGGSYNMEEAIMEGRDLLRRFDVELHRKDLFGAGRELAF